MASDNASNEVASEVKPGVSNVFFGRLGHMEEFSPDNAAAWPTYLERLQFSFTANGVVEEEQQRAVLCSVCGAAMYAILRTLCSPATPAETPYADIRLLAETALDFKKAYEKAVAAEYAKRQTAAIRAALPARPTCIGWIKHQRGTSQVQLNGAPVSNSSRVEGQAAVRDQSKVVTTVKTVLQDYSEVFKPGLGKSTGPPVRIEVEEQATPKFHKPRQVPFALLPKVEEAIKHRLPLPVKDELEPPLGDILLLEAAPEVPLDSTKITAWTRTDPVLSRVHRWILQGWPSGKVPEEFRPFVARKNELPTYRNCVLWGSRVVIPCSAQAQVLDILHTTHPGVVRMKGLARTTVWWPGIDNHIERKIFTWMDHLFSGTSWTVLEVFGSSILATLCMHGTIRGAPSGFPGSSLQSRGSFLTRFVSPTVAYGDDMLIRSAALPAHYLLGGADSDSGGDTADDVDPSLVGQDLPLPGVSEALPSSNPPFSPAPEPNNPDAPGSPPQEQSSPSQPPAAEASRYPRRDRRAPQRYPDYIRFFAPLSKLVFAVYIAHQPLQYLFYASRQESFDYNYFLMGYFYVGSLALSFAVAVVLSLVIEIPICNLEKLVLGLEVRNLHIKIKFDVTRRQERPLILGFQADGQRYVDLQEDTTAPSLLEMIADIAGATVDSLVAEASLATPRRSNIFERLPEELLTAAIRLSPRCRHDILVYVTHLQSGSDWALRMFDSTGKMESGVMTGGRTFPGLLF
ncbi:hypothetical protein MTO96_028789 [Rhipicephalus appendiculatus]